jgi:hypothetical protein
MILTPCTIGPNSGALSEFSAVFNRVRTAKPTFIPQAELYQMIHDFGRYSCRFKILSMHHGQSMAIGFLLVAG